MLIDLIYGIYRKMFARKRFSKMNQALLNMSLRGLGILNYENGHISGERYLINEALRKIIMRSQPVFFDVGANVGNYSTELLNAFPDATIHAFEPHPKNYSSLKRLASAMRIQAYPMALGDQAGEACLYDRADMDGSAHASLHEAVISEIHKQGKVAFTIPVSTLDAFADEHRIDHIDFLKIDTEGNELAVLRGATRLLDRGAITCIHFEFNEMNVVSGVFFRDFRRTLKGFDFYRLLPNDLLPLNDSPLETEIFAYQNILAIKRK